MSLYASQQPLIGIPSGSVASSAPGTRTYRFNGNYTNSVAAAGGLPVAIPLDLPEDALQALFIRLDGLLLAGGDDVDPVCYGEAPHPALGAVDPARDETELRVARWALAAHLPTFAVCRGIQVLNVAAGGSLYQDIPAQLPAALRHDYSPAISGWDRPTHDVSVEAGSRLAAVMATAAVATNSFHHQSVKSVAAGFVPVAWAPDGVIEAIEAPDQPFAVGVQWHPEAMTRIDEAARRLFRAFVEAARG